MKKGILYVSFTIAAICMMLGSSIQVRAEENSRQVYNFQEFQEALMEASVSEIYLQEDIFQDGEEQEPLVIPGSVTIYGNDYILSLSSQAMILEGDLVINDCDLRFTKTSGNSIILNYHELILNNVSTLFSESPVDIYAGAFVLQGTALYRTGDHGVVLLSESTFVDDIYAGNFTDNEGENEKALPVTIIISSPKVQLGTIDAFIGEEKSATVVYKGSEQEEKSLSLRNGGNIEILSGHVSLTSDSYFYHDKASLLVEAGAILDLSKIRSNLKFKDYVGEGKLFLGENQTADFSGRIEEEVLPQKPKSIPVSVSRIVIEDKLYDGMVNAKVKEILFSDGSNHNLMISNEATASFKDPSVGTAKEVQVVITLKNTEYELTQKEIKTTGNILQKPETIRPQEKVETKLDIRAGFNAEGITPSLQEKGFTSVFKIEDTLYTLLQSLNTGFESRNSKLYEVSLLARKNQNEQWRKAAKEEFPQDGRLKVRMAVPEGTSVDTHDYTVLHMFSDHHFYRTAGQVENPKVVKVKKDGQSYLEFELVGTSPLLVAWKEISKPAVVQNNSQTNSVAQTSQSTATQHSQPASSNTGKVQPKIKTIDPALKSTKNTEANFSSSYKKDQGDDQKNGVKEDPEVVKREKETIQSKEALAQKVDTQRKTMAEMEVPKKQNYGLFFLTLGISTVALIALGTAISIFRNR